MYFSCCSYLYSCLTYWVLLSLSSGTHLWKRWLVLKALSLSLYNKVLSYLSLSHAHSLALFLHNPWPCLECVSVQVCAATAKGKGERSTITGTTAELGWCSVLLLFFLPVPIAVLSAHLYIPLLSQSCLHTCTFPSCHSPVWCLQPCSLLSVCPACHLSWSKSAGRDSLPRLTFTLMVGDEGHVICLLKP